ncbi:sensor histidine kinase [Parachryseolinea silvisoli]|uniref:sensor histidine kinase n=1 Tax=Parachryseolinea silvisoli TaxID=2873601 RepID=UPI002265A87A|nr:HAMP domain-containing sensor histidine kinase [Parachryseolinea silvisoli]MCD9014157.1 HAMP domain-containing histidine kinase [Parachryseolinea silvisoli]
MTEFSLDIIARIGELSPDGYIVYDYKSNIVEYSNAVFSRMADQEARSGYSLLLLRHLVAEDDEFINACIRQFIRENVLSNIELRLCDNRYVAVDAYIFSDHQLMLIVRDVTKLKEFLNYVSDFGARKDAILDMVSHNLSGPLHMTNNLLNALDQTTEKQQYDTIAQHSQLIRQNTQHCIEIINSFLKEEHLASARIFVESVRFDVVQKINVVIERISAFDKEKQIVLESAQDSLFVTLDDVKFFQVVHNVLSNAVKFTPAGGVVRVVVDSSDDTFTVSVEDNGVGIPEHLQPHIFERNTAASRPGLKGERSIGMGLYIVKELVILMGGSVALSSKENVGTSVVMTLPKARFGAVRH